MSRLIDELTDISPLSAGGQKQVYTASHPQHGTVVLKRIKPKSPSVDIERTRREIRAVQKIRSEHVPVILEHNLNDATAESLYLVEQYVDAPTLRTLIARGARFSTRDVILFLETLLSVCAVAEQHRIVHRDIKPENILVEAGPKYWVLDFGIARHLDLQSITATNAPFGLFTIGYASSEQFRNIKREIDVRADLFAIGVVATEMLTGMNPYIAGETDALSVLRKIERHPVPLCSIVGDAQYQLATFIRILGDNRKSRRPRTATEAQAILAAVKATVRY